MLILHRLKFIFYVMSLKIISPSLNMTELSGIPLMKKNYEVIIYSFSDLLSLSCKRLSVYKMNLDLKATENFKTRQAISHRA